MTPQDAADKLRPTFHLETMPAEDRHHVKFVEDVATALGVEHSAFNLHQVAEALDAANVHADSNEFPKMKWSRRHHAVDGVEASVYDKRHDAVYASVKSEDEEKALGEGWFDSIADLPPRGDTPIKAEGAKVEGLVAEEAGKAFPD